MKKTILPILLFSSLLLPAQQTLSEKLGYTKDTKLLILHADDLGVTHSENTASIAAMKKGVVNSASIMVPCPWFPEIAAYARAHPKADLGLHLTLTSEWKYYKWGSVAPKEKVPGLVSAKRFLFDDVDSLYANAKPEEVETELRAQIERAKQFGIDFTHFDSHMAALFGRADYLQILIKLGREYKVPVLLNKEGARSALNANLDNFVNENDVLLDDIYTANPDNYKKGMENYYTDIFQSLKQGVSIILLHAAYNDSEMQAVTIDHPNWGAAWRQADFDFFTSEKCKKVLKEQNIKLITWREIRDKLLRKP
jgi:chitin disaccharide deacetylase